MIASEVHHSRNWHARPSVERILDAVAGSKPRLHPAELRRAVTVLTQRGWSQAKIARHLGCAQRTVVRHRRGLL